MLDSYNLLDMQIVAVQHEQVLAQMGSWISDQNAGRYILVANVQNVIEAHKSLYFNAAIDYASARGIWAVSWY
jgi:UDP-N-acetyl-D-mannosaminuronic acid transferase (WecB/TagA/CpsF family)